MRRQSTASCSIRQSRDEVRGLHLLLLASIALAGACDSPPSIDHYTLALSWQPAFCESHAGKPECGALDSGDFAATNLALHGLWPNGAGDEHPFYCGVAAAERSLDEAGEWCELPATGADQATQTDLAQVMPGSQSCLDRHEWTKHGTCSGLGGDAYFDAAARLVRDMQSTRLAKLLRGNIGMQVSRRNLLASFEQDFGAGTAAALELACRRNGGSAYLIEIRLALRPDAIGKPLSGNALFLFGRPPRGSCPAQIFIDPAG